MNSLMNMVKVDHTFQSVKLNVTSGSSCQPSASSFTHFTILSQFHAIIPLPKN